MNFVGEDSPWIVSRNKCRAMFRNDVVRVIRLPRRPWSDVLDSPFSDIPWSWSRDFVSNLLSLCPRPRKMKLNHSLDIMVLLWCRKEGSCHREPTDRVYFRHTVVYSTAITDSISTGWCSEWIRRNVGTQNSIPRYSTHEVTIQLSLKILWHIHTLRSQHLWTWKTQ